MFSPIIQPPQGGAIAFTPTIIGTSTAGTGTYNSQVGWYTRIGSLITFVGFVNISAHDGTGNMEIAGLPYTNIAMNTPVDLNVSALTWSNTLQGYVKTGGTTIALVTVASTTGETALAIDTACAIRFRGNYFAA